MYSEEIKRQDWPVFLNDFSRRHLGESVTIQILTSDLGNQFEAKQLPLLGITADNKSSEGELIEVMVGDSPQRNTNRLIRNPEHVRLAKSDDGIDQALEIESPGQTTLILRLEGTQAPGVQGA